MTNRVRERHHKPKKYLDCTLTDYDTGDSSITSTHLISYDHEWMSDVSTPDFDARIGRGEIVNNAMSYFRKRRSGNSSDFGFYDAYTPNGSAGSWTRSGPIHLEFIGSTDQRLFPSFLSYDVNEMIELAKAKAIAEIDSTPYEFGEDLGELRSTLKSIKQTLTGIRRIFVKTQREVRLLEQKRAALKRLPSTSRRLKQIKDFTDAIANAWLSYRFFISPLLKSAHDAMEAFLEGVPPYPDRRNARGFEKFDENFSDHVTSLGNGKRGYHVSETVTISVHAHIHYQVSNPLMDWRRAFGLRAKDIPATAWQLVPYSFMVDRFLDISSFVKGVINFANPSLLILGASVTVKTTEQLDFTQGSAYSPLPGPSWTISETLGAWNEHLFTMTRDIWEPTILDTVPNPNLDGLFENVTFITDLLALSWAALSR